MIVAVCSDVHDNIWALERTLPRMAEADAYVFCGDFCAPFTLAQLAEATAAKPLHVVWGNNDGDRHMLTQVAARFDHVVLHGELSSVELGGLRTAVNHYPDIASGLADSGRYDIVLYGHDHVPHEERRETANGPCLLVNPGEIMGRLGTTTFRFLNTDDGTTELVAID